MALQGACLGGPCAPYSPHELRISVRAGAPQQCEERTVQYPENGRHKNQLPTPEEAII